MFTDQDTVLVTVGEDGFARRYDVESGKLLIEEQIHTEMITDMQAGSLALRLLFDAFVCPTPTPRPCTSHLVL